MKQRGHYSPSTGVALLPALIVLLLITVVVILFFSLATSQLRSSASHVAGHELGALQDTAINLAIAQLRRGTTEPNAIWTSQPGALRTYRANTGKASRIYKLYSSQDMDLDAAVLATPTARNLEDDVPEHWSDLPDVYADLNTPSQERGGHMAFPIVDPRAMAVEAAGDPVRKTPEGFSYSGQMAVSKKSIEGVKTPTDGATGQRLPMPVQWLYVLADGSLGTLHSDTKKFVPLQGQKPASASNPIVGRIAFWTDDESCKVNINTATESIFWDTPRCATPEDVKYARQPPTRNEVQRFGGHPATTCLSSVFLPGRYLSPESDSETLKQLYQLAPRVNTTGGVLAGNKKPVSFDKDRLYASMDEFLLDPAHQEQKFFQDDPSRLERLRFFLTAHSRAPETTAAGTPRVCLWPTYYADDNQHRTAFDKLMAFCSTLGGKYYFFRRESANTNIGEYKDVSYSGMSTGMSSNASLGGYLLGLTGKTVNGYPVSLADKYDPSGVKRNIGTGVLSFMEYMRQTNLHDTTMAPAGSPVVPYAVPFGNVWIGSEIHGQVTNMDQTNLPSVFQKVVVGNDSTEGASNGLAREYTLSEFGLAFLLAAENKSDGTKFNPGLVSKLNLPVGTKAIQVAPIFEGFCPAQGYTMSAPSSSAKATPMNSLILNGSAVKYSTQWGSLDISVAHLAYLSAAGISKSGSKSSPADWWVGWGGSGGRWMYADNNSTNDAQVGAVTTHADLDNPSRKYLNEYSRGYFQIASSTNQIKVNATTLQVYVGNQRDGDFAKRVLQVRVPEFYVPVPSSGTLPPSWGQRYEDAARNRYQKPEIIDPNDVVRTWVVRHGDYRLVYLHEREGSAVPANNLMFVPHPDWDPNGPKAEVAKTIKQLNAFTKPGGEPELNATFHRGLVRNANYANAVRPDFALDPDKDKEAIANRPSSYKYSLDPSDTRDWDNGTGIAPDGAYWNKPDDVAHQFDGSIPPYFSKRMWDGINANAVDETTAPNQLIPSAGMFGSIPSAAFTGLQWTTYLFRPDITPGGHLGAKDHSILGQKTGAPPDHILLDWFWMPVVQPYAISEPFSTAGKVNMNYRMVPFTYIKRATGLHAVMKSERMLAIPTTAGGTYKQYNSYSSNTGWRQPIDSERTLLQWEEKFDAGESFLNASEVCEQFLVPMNKPISASSASAVRTAMKAFWNQNGLTGDNTMERPYANIYARLTTRSNSYRIHYLVQTLKKTRGTDPDTFDSIRDAIVGENQGDAVVERSIDPADPALSTPDYDYISNPNAKSLDTLYSWRIRHQRRFVR